jgi:hypothetical protein
MAAPGMFGTLKSTDRPPWHACLQFRAHRMNGTNALKWDYCSIKTAQNCSCLNSWEFSGEPPPRKLASHGAVHASWGTTSGPPSDDGLAACPASELCD